MRIEDASVQLAGSRAFESEYTTEVSARSSFRRIFAEASAAGAAEEPAPLPDGSRPERVRRMLEQLLAEVLALISGAPRVPVEGVALRALPADGEAPLAARPGRQVEFEWQSEVTERIREYERSDFSARGTVRTADGKAIDFDLDLTMCREFSCTRTFTESGKVVMRDPLVINFDGKAAELTDTRFAFDLDADGKDESLARLAAGSGFLALDRDGDGRINDGRELFGAQSGDGFADLAALDSDGNRWLDDADALFAALRVWTPPDAAQAGGAAADGRLETLAERGVGALYLGSVETPFALKDADNRSRGQVRASGVYLGDDGRAGTLQQIDLAV